MGGGRLGYSRATTRLRRAERSLASTGESLPTAGLEPVVSRVAGRDERGRDTRDALIVPFVGASTAKPRDAKPTEEGSI